MKMAVPSILLVLFSIVGVQVNAQQDSLRKDSTLLPAILGGDSTKKLTDSLEKMYQSTDTGTTNLVTQIEYYTQRLNKANITLKRGFDTLSITEKLPEFEDNVQLIQEFVNSDVSISNQRSLSLGKILLLQMEQKLEQWQQSLLSYSVQLAENNVLFNKISTDSSLKVFPSDTVLRNQYVSQINILAGKWLEADTINKANLYRIAYLQNRVSMSYLKVVDLLDIVNARMFSYSKQVFRPEYQFLLSTKAKGRYDSSFIKSFRKSFRSNTRVFVYYSRATTWFPLIYLLGGLVFFLWIRRTILKVRQSTDGDMKLSQTKYLGKDPLICTVIVSFTLAPFVYANPPVLYSELLMMVNLVALSFFALREWTKTALKFWLVAVLIFVFYGSINLLVTTTQFERWLFFFVTLFSIFYGIRLLKFLSEGDTKIKKMAIPICKLFVFLQFVSLFANFIGRYSLAKICSVTAIYGLTQALVIFCFIEIVLEAIYLELESNKNQSGLISYFNYKDLDKRLRSVLIVIGVLLWTMITLRNLNVYDYIYNSIDEFLEAPRKLGSTVFTYWSIVVFIIVIVISTFLSRIVGYIFGNPQGSIKGIAKSKIGSGVLLIRLGIYALGLLVAFVASGIPMDKITIILGALGVGIGFGLQGIVNNLVSGIILAFEKPIQIGDVIEVGTRMGVVSEIGIRSSKIYTYDGSTVIIPNGDLIAQHIINWTHGNTNRRVEALVGVAYGSDTNLCHDLITEVLDDSKFVMKDPKPLILLNDFGNSSVDFRILFWTNDINRWVETRSDIMRAIYSKFDEKGISIPFPQQDLHIKSIDPDVAKSILKGE